MFKDLKLKIKKTSNKSVAKRTSSFAQTEKGQYAEGDIYIGIRVPICREIAKQYIDLNIQDLQKLISSKIHEERLIALLILVEKYKINPLKKYINFYIKNTKYVNNWDLVDLSADKLLGNHLLDKKKDILYKLVKSEDLWERRIAIVSTWELIKNNQLTDCIKLSNILLKDQIKRDPNTVLGKRGGWELINKAVGWMLREAGKKDKKTLTRFLDKNCKIMPRTMLRYSIEKLTAKEKLRYIK